MFHRQFPDIKVSASTIERVYFAGGVRYKFINRIKKTIDFSTEYYGNLFRTMCHLLQKVKTDNMKLLYLDEAIFSFNTMRSKAWSSAYSSIDVHDAKMKMKAQAIVAAISEDIGYEHHLLNLRSISTEQYVQFMEELSEKY